MGIVSFGAKWVTPISIGAASAAQQARPLAPSGRARQPANADYRVGSARGRTAIVVLDHALRPRSEGADGYIRSANSPHRLASVLPAPRLFGQGLPSESTELNGHANQNAMVGIYRDETGMTRLSHRTTVVVRSGFQT
jgi:hypothetical protein